MCGRSSCSGGGLHTVRPSARRSRESKRPRRDSLGWWIVQRTVHPEERDRGRGAASGELRPATSFLGSLRSVTQSTAQHHAADFRGARLR